MKNRFDLEQELLDCWLVTGDLALILHGELDENDMQNALIGLITLYELKHQKLWATFEECIKRGELK